MVTTTPQPGAQPRRAGRTPLVGALAVAVVGGAVLAGVTLAGRSSHPHPWVAAPIDQVVTGRVGAPPLQKEGQAVRVEVAHGAVTAVVAGPRVPAVGAAQPAPTTTTTFTVTLSGATTAVPVSIDQFGILDQTGRFVHPVLDPGTPAPPATLAAGASTTFQLRAYLPVGEGIVSWAPDGTHVEAKWDFVVETD